MKFMLVLLTPGLLLIGGLYQLTTAASQSANLAMDTTDPGLLVTASNSFTAGVLLAAFGMVLLVFLFNAAFLIVSRA